MKVCNPIKWGFDPRTSTFHPVLSTETGRIIWGAIRMGHIVDQYFSDQVLRLVDKITERFPDDPGDLRRMAEGAGLGAYATKEADTRPACPLWSSSIRVPDMEWWGDLFDILKGRELKQEYPASPAPAKEATP